MKRLLTRMCNAYAEKFFEGSPRLRDILQASPLQSSSSMQSSLHSAENHLQCLAQYRSQPTKTWKQVLEKTCPLCQRIVSSETLVPHLSFQHGTEELIQYIIDRMGNPDDLGFDFQAQFGVQCLCGQSFTGQAWQVFQDLVSHLLNQNHEEHKAMASLGVKISLNRGCRDENAQAPVSPEFECVKENEDKQCCC